MEVREFDWDSSRKGASQLPRTKTIRLSTPKTTTGENLILGYTSPLSTTIRHHRKNLPHTEDAELMLQVGHRPVVRVWEATDAVTKVIVT